MSDNFEYSYSAERQNEIEAIRKKYLPQAEQESKLAQLRKLDAGVGTRALIASMALGILGALVFGAGMCSCGCPARSPACWARCVCCWPRRCTGGSLKSAKRRSRRRSCG